MFLCVVGLCILSGFSRLAGPRAGRVCVWPSECTPNDVALSELGLIRLIEHVFGVMFVLVRLLLAICVRVVVYVIAWLPL